MIEHYPNAAHRHLEDSKVLLDALRWDGSAYLAGYVIECSLKATIVAPSPSCPKGQQWPGDGHGIDSLVSCVELMAASRRSGFKRNVPSHLLVAIKHASAEAPKWHPNMRYKSAGVLEQESKRWWILAKRAFVGMAKPFCSGGVR